MSAGGCRTGATVKFLQLKISTFYQNGVVLVANRVHPDKSDILRNLCNKLSFTTENGTWVRCPFVSGAFPAWKMKTVFTDEVMQIKFTSSAKAKFSVVICNRTKHNSCDSIQRHALVYVGLRVDVNYSFPVQICNIPCNASKENAREQFVEIKSETPNTNSIPPKKMQKKKFLKSKMKNFPGMDQHGNLLWLIIQSEETANNRINNNKP
ncbi:interleukin-17 receptor E-like protein [Phyllobates terribilis]|uniref:interleukin-17 receptor E-like protein n=1 Tax=Phyllobates terribilis TaxID=111132 RepID=UPI003CCAF58B